jgi:subtilisin family serine protease
MGELILTIPNGAAGKIALERLSGGNDLGVEYRLPMTDVFNKLDLRADRLLQLQQSYHLVSVRDGDEIPVISRILRRFDDPENMQGPGKVTYAEYNWQGSLSSPLLAFDPVNHATYVANLNVAAAYKAGVWGRGVRVAVIDSGVDAAFVHRSYDVFSATNAWSSGGIDMLGHGSAMAMIIHDIAPDRLGADH